MQQGAVTFELQGLDRLRARLLKAGDRAVPLLGKTMYRFAEDIMTDSKENYVPVSAKHPKLERARRQKPSRGSAKSGGNLKASGFVEHPHYGSVTTVTLGYGGAAAPYALAVHENPRTGKTGGFSPSGQRYTSWSAVGQWKYLEAPFLKWKPRYAGVLSKKLREVFGV